MIIGQTGPLRRKRRKGVRSLPVFVASVTLVLSAFFGMLSAPQANAQDTYPNVNMTAVSGFSSYYGQNHWVPVTLSIHNIGSARRVTLRLDVNYPTDNSRVAEGGLKWPVWLPANGWRKVQVAVPGEMITLNGAIDCEVDGQVVSSVSLVGNALRNVALVAVLSSMPSDSQFLSGTTDGATGQPVLAIPLDSQTVPTVPSLFNNLTAIAATPDALAKLSVSQQRALDEWVRLGGFLLVMGSKESASSYWSSELPFVPGPAHVVAGEPLATYAGITTSAAPRVISYAKGLRRGATAWSPMPTGNPLIAVMNIGRGKILQTAFEPFQKELLIWSGSSPLWTTVLRQGVTQSQSANQALLDPTGVLSLSQAANTLSPMRVPSLGFWLTVFLLYILVIGPALFFVLRRAKREAWAWFILPTVSIVLSIGIYSFGASERPSGPLVAGVGVLDLVGDGTAETYGVQAFMSPYISNTQVSMPSSVFALPLGEASVRQQGDAEVTSLSNTQATFTGVGRWRVRYLYSAGSVIGQGFLDAKLEASFGILSGVVMNDTRYTLQNVALFWDGHMFHLGDMKPGDLVAVTNETPVEDAVTDWFSNYSSYNRDITRGLGHTLGNYAASENMFDSSITDDSAMLVATTSSGVPSLPAIRNAGSSQTLVLVRQYADVTLDRSGGIP